MFGIRCLLFKRYLFHITPCHIDAIFLAAVIEPAVKSHIDRKRTEETRESLGKPYFEKLFGDYFSEYLRRANIFRLNYSDRKPYKALVDTGYNAIIELNMEELCLKRAGQTDKLNVYVSVWGKMVDLQSEQVIWSHHEVIMNDEEHTLDEYKADRAILLRELIDKAFRKIAYRLANNFIYAK